MHTYETRTFDLPELTGISPKQVEVHLGLYAGYVKHVNVLREKIHELENDKEKNAYTIAELRRRFSFEFNGMRMHEYYFEQFGGGSNESSADSTLAKAVTEKYGSMEEFVAHFKAVAGLRGIGWVVLYADPAGNTVHTAWISDHELGTLAGLPIILAMDMWEHAFMVDYVPSEKGTYVDAFLQNLNWGVVERRFEAVK